jgi:hypothetical protein
MGIHIHDRLISTHTSGGHTYSNAYLVGGYGSTLAAFKALAEVARADFPSLTDAQITCSVVVRSDRCKNCIVVHFQVPPGTRIEGYRNVDQSPDFQLAS